jgi:hypothetical protein
MATPRLKHSILCAVGGAALLILTAGAAQATCIGTCGTDTANGDVTNPPGFSSYHYVTTTGGPAAGGNLPSVFGSAGVNSTNGSTFTTAPFTATAGDSVNFYFNYVTSDGSGFPDYAWAALMSTTGGHGANPAERQHGSRENHACPCAGRLARTAHLPDHAWLRHQWTRGCWRAGLGGVGFLERILLCSGLRPHRLDSVPVRW